MSIFKTFYPNEMQESTYHIDFKKIYRKGYRGIIFDVDNTLVPHGAMADEACIQLFLQLKELGFKTVLLSNNKEERVKRFNEKIETDYIYKAGKPAKRNYLRAIKIMGIKKSETLFVGDQLFTDVWGAKRVGIYSILVKPLHPKEEIQIVLKRYLEKIVLYFYLREKEKKRGSKW